MRPRMWAPNPVELMSLSGKRERQQGCTCRERTWDSQQGGGHLQSNGTQLRRSQTSTCVTRFPNQMPCGMAPKLHCSGGWSSRSRCGWGGLFLRAWLRIYPWLSPSFLEVLGVPWLGDAPLGPLPPPSVGIHPACLSTFKFPCLVKTAVVLDWGPFWSSVASS